MKRRTTMTGGMVAIELSISEHQTQAQARIWRSQRHTEDLCRPCFRLCHRPYSQAPCAFMATHFRVLLSSRALISLSGDRRF